MPNDIPLTNAAGELLVSSDGELLVCEADCCAACVPTDCACGEAFGGPLSVEIGTFGGPCSGVNGVTFELAWIEARCSWKYEDADIRITATIQRHLVLGVCKIDYVVTILFFASGYQVRCEASVAASSIDCADFSQIVPAATYTGGAGVSDCFLFGPFGPRQVTLGSV
jgi:hypothetical protein